MKIFKADHHIHTCLSPCADLDMSPRKVVENSIESGIDFIAVCDHNSVEDIGRVFTRFIIEEPGLDEVRMALKGDAGRRVLFN